jgi:hypothetical protein
VVASKDVFSLHLTGSHYLLFFPIVPGNKCQTPGGSSGGGPNVDPTTGGLLREPGELREGECDSSKFPVIQDAHDITFCRSNNDCDGYKPRKAALGTVCCLRDRCFCGTTADAGGCYADPQFRLGEPGSSFMITVPTVPPPPIQENP